MQRPKLTTTVWEDEGTLCYQVDAKSVCVARRQDNDMINGTKLLNVVGMSRGKRDGILKNEKGRVVVKVGAMHLKGVWITFSRAKDLANKFKIADILYPLFVEDPSVFLTVPPPPPSSSITTSTLPMMLPSSSSTPARNYNSNNSNYSFNMWDKHPYQSLPSIGNQQDQMLMRSHPNQQTNSLQNGSCSPVPGNIAPILSSTEENDMYLLNNPYDYRSSNTNTTSNNNNSRYGNSTYHIYSNDHTTSNDNHFSPYDTNSSYVQQRKLHSVIDHKDEASHLEEKRNSIDFPTSPPPETSHKYTSPYSLHSGSSNWSEPSKTLNHELDTSNRKPSPLESSTSMTSPTLLRNNNNILMTAGRHPLSNELEEDDEEEDRPLKGRKRGYVTKSSANINIQRKRLKNDKNGSP